MRLRPQLEFLTFENQPPPRLFWTVRLLRSCCGNLLFYAQQIIDGVQNCVLPLYVILEPEDVPSHASIKYSGRGKRGFLARNDRHTSLQLRPRFSDNFYRILPSERARGEDEPFHLIGGWNFEREYVCPRHVTHVHVQRRRAGRGVVPADGTIWRARDEPVDVSVRARSGRVVDLA